MATKFRHTEVIKNKSRLRTHQAYYNTFHANVSLSGFFALNVHALSLSLSLSNRQLPYKFVDTLVVIELNSNVLARIKSVVYCVKLSVKKDSELQ